jgi:hypothetical protein
MEGLEAATSSAVVAPAAAPAPTAAAAPTPTPALETTPAAATSSSSSGGMGSIKEVFQSINWNEVLFGILGTAALYYTIYYYRYNITAGKAINTEMQNKIDDLSIKIADLQSANQRDELLGNQSFDGMFY